MGTTHLNLRGPFPGLERFEFLDDIANHDGSLHMTGSARGSSAHNVHPQPATLSITNERALLFFSSRRAARPITARFKLIAGDTGLIIKGIRVDRSRTKDKLCATVTQSHPLLIETKGLQPKSPPENQLKEVELALFYDSSFKPPWAGQNILEYLSAVTYAANQLYLRRLGVVARIKRFSAIDLDIPYANPTSDTLLELFRSQISTSKSSADLFHLFVSAMRDDQTAGLAYVGSACDTHGNYAVGLSRSVGPAMQPIVLAHELAHGLGARHDQPANSLMNEILTTDNTRVTKLTKQSVSKYAERFGSCLSESSDSKVTIAANVGRDLFQSSVIVSRPRTGGCRLTLQAREMTSKPQQRWIPLSEAALAPVDSNDTSVRLFKGSTAALSLAAPGGAAVRAVLKCGIKRSYSREIQLQISKENGAINAREGSKSVMWSALRESIRIE